MTTHHETDHHASHSQPIDPDGDQHEMEPRLRKFFEQAIRYQSSDLIVKSDSKIRLRLRGDLKSLDAEPFTSKQLHDAIETFLTDEQLDHFKHHGSVDLAYAYDEDNRFRVNIFLARGKITIAARRVSSEILTYEQLHLPPELKDIPEARQGLVLVCGITGSGKSTTIASMLQQVNLNRACHIVTLEDPIEFIFKDAKAMINQREIGVDVPDFETGLRSIVRENPDVILIGELRDRATFEAAVRAAETGHLVFGTVHASSASQAFSRIYNLFPEEERDLIRAMFASNMRAVIYQKLLPTVRDDVERVPALEVLRNNPVVYKYIADSREAELIDVIRNSEQDNMMDFTTSLVKLVQNEYIHPRTAIDNAANPDEVKMKLKGIKTGAGL